MTRSDPWSFRADPERQPTHPPRPIGEDFDEDYDGDIDEDIDGDLDEEPREDKSWRWVAGVAGAVLLVAVVATIVILTGDNGGAVGKVVPQTSRPAVAPAPPPSPPSPTITTSLPPETVSTVTPSAAPTRSSAPTSQPQRAAEAPPPPPAPRTVVYTISGNRRAGDLVTVTYTDERGAFHTDLNVLLPWSRTFVMNPDVTVNSVTATSFASQLNCTITDGLGGTLVSQNFNTIAATCNH